MEPWWLFWNVTQEVKWLFYISIIVSLLISIKGVRKTLLIWEKGIDDPDEEIYNLKSFDLIKLSFKMFFSPDCLLAKRLSRVSNTRRFFLIITILSSVILIIGVLINFLDYFTHFTTYISQIIPSFAYTFVFISGLFEILGIALIISVLFHLIRRFTNGERIPKNPEVIGMNLIILLLVISGFLIEGIRVSMIKIYDTEFIGSSISFYLKLHSLDKTFLLSLHKLFWIIHVSSFIILLAYFPYSYFSHLFASQITLYAAKRREEGEKEDE